MKKAVLVIAAVVTVLEGPAAHAEPALFVGGGITIDPLDAPRPGAPAITLAAATATVGIHVDRVAIDLSAGGLVWPKFDGFARVDLIAAGGHVDLYRGWFVGVRGGHAHFSETNEVMQIHSDVWFAALTAGAHHTLSNGFTFGGQLHVDRARETRPGDPTVGNTLMTGVDVSLGYRW